MLTRLRISGFKNLADVDIRFGPFTCVAGANGAGKSNLFDAIRFLSALADMPVMDAARQVRYESGTHADTKALFHCAHKQRRRTIRLEAEFIIPQTGIDNLGRTVIARHTVFSYAVTLTYASKQQGNGRIRLTSEKLKLLGAENCCAFSHSPAWFKSVIKISKPRGTYIQRVRQTDSGQYAIVLKRENGAQVISAEADKLERTLLSDVTAKDNPAAFLVRQELRSWRVLHLEPSLLRKPGDPDNSSRELAGDGSNLSEVLYYLANRDAEQREQIYARIANQLALLIDCVHAVRVKRDKEHNALILQAAWKDRLFHDAAALSDGTLRFLALAVLEEEMSNGLLCLEEPENGIHPARISAIVSLLEAIAMDTEEYADVDNPLRQVIINTHSPWLVQYVADNSLLFAKTLEFARKLKGKFIRVENSVVFLGMSNTWRAEPNSEHSISKGSLLSYLRTWPPGTDKCLEQNSIRIREREDLQEYL